MFLMIQGLHVQSTARPVKSDSDVMFCLQSYLDLESIDHLNINPIRVSSSGVYRLMFYLTIVKKYYTTVTLYWHDSNTLKRVCFCW